MKEGRGGGSTRHERMLARCICRPTSCNATFAVRPLLCVRMDFVVQQRHPMPCSASSLAMLPCERSRVSQK